MEVSLMEMLDARERRVRRQKALLEQYGKTLLCFTMNIPGPVKWTPLISRGFAEGNRQLAEALASAGIRVLHREEEQPVTGCTAYVCADASAERVKAITAAIEDASALGRLFDMDVLTSAGTKLEREAVNGKSRDCIVCGAPGRGCASRRLHTVEQLQEAAQTRLRNHFAPVDAQRIGTMAVESLLEEVRTTPKPALVDLRNNGSHRDMDADTFTRSAHALKSYFVRCVQIGQETAQFPPEETFPLLRQAGLEAEEAMYAATGGVNTHKGAIYTMGVLCGAAGRLWQPEGGSYETEPLLRQCAALVAESVPADFSQGESNTAGLRLYRQRGLTGIRGEMAAGLPSVANIALPVFQNACSRGFSRNDAGAAALLHLIAGVEDTNLYHRGGEAGAAFARESAAALLRYQEFPTTAQLEALDDAFIQRNLSPGGCADLLAATYLLDMLDSSQG